MTPGNASRNVPPNAMSHTSCQLQRGPRAAMISRRSDAVRPAIKCSAPAPMFQPSSTAKSVSVTQRKTNHTSTMRCPHGHGFRTVQDLAPDEIEIEEAEDEVEPHHSDQ